MHRPRRSRRRRAWPSARQRPRDARAATGCRARTGARSRSLRLASLGSSAVRRALTTAAVLIAFFGCSNSHPVALPSAPKTMELATPYVINAARLPRLYTCDGDNLSPAFQWAGVPANAKELALLMVDRDSPGGRFVHWAVFGMPPQDGSVALGKAPGTQA